MANYLNQAGLTSVLRSLNEVWLSSSGVLNYTKVAHETYPVLRSTKNNTLDSLYVDVSDIWDAIDDLSTTAASTYSFKNIKVGTNTIVADTIGDTLEIAAGASGPISVTGDTSNDKVTISHNTSTVTAGTYGATGSTSSALGGANTFTIPAITVDSYGHVTGASNKNVTITMPTNQTLSFGVDTTDKLSYDGKAVKNIYLTGSSGTTISASTSTDNNTLTYTIKSPYPTTFAWTAGTTAGPTGSLTGANDLTTVSFGAIPSATANQSGIVTTGTQTFAGAKTFNGVTTFGAQAKFTATNTAPFTVTSTTKVANLNADLLDGHSSEHFATQEALDALSDDLNSKVTGLFEYKGTIGTGGTVTTLPASHEVGDVYYVKTAGTYAGVSCEVGDMIICNTAGTTAKNSDWNVVQGNWTATDGSSELSWGNTTTLATIGGVSIDAKLPSASFFKSVTAPDGTINGANNTLEFIDDDVVNITVSNSKLRLSHKAAGSGITTTTKDVGDTSAQTPSFGGTFNVPSFTVDTYGHLTAAAHHTVKIPNATASTSSNGLMTSAQVTKLNGIDANATADGALTTVEINAAFTAAGITLE